MLECNLNKNDGTVIIRENGEDVFKSKLVIDSNMAFLDEIEFSDKKTEELSSGNVLQSAISFLTDVEEVVIKSSDEMGLNIYLVTFGNFAAVKRLDAIVHAFNLDVSRETTQSSKR